MEWEAVKNALNQATSDFRALLSTGEVLSLDPKDVIILIEHAEKSQQLAEKDAIIKKFEDDAMYWYQEAEKARFMFLAAHDEHKRTRKALEDAKDSIQVIEAHGERPWEVTSYCDRAIELIDDVLGEGDKE